MFIFIPILIFVALVIVGAGIKIVPQGRQWTIGRFGRCTRTLRPGLSPAISFMDRIGHETNMMEQVLDIPSQEVVSEDNANVPVDTVCFTQVIDIPKAVYEVSNLELAIINLIMTNIRTALDSMELDKIFSQRGSINARLLHIADKVTGPWGIEITHIEIRDTRPPAELTDAMNTRTKAEHTKRACILEAKGIRQVEIVGAEGEKRSKIFTAKGERQSAFLQVETYGRSTEAEARTTQAISEAIAAGNIQTVDYSMAQKCAEVLQHVGSSNNNRMVMMPLDTSSLVSFTTGIIELVKDSVNGREKS